MPLDRSTVDAVLNPGRMGPWLITSREAVLAWLTEPTPGTPPNRAQGTYQVDTWWGSPDPGDHVLDAAAAHTIHDVLQDLAADGIITSPIGARALLDTLTEDDGGNTDVRVMAELDTLAPLIVDHHIGLHELFTTEPGKDDPHHGAAQLAAAVITAVEHANRLISKFFVVFQPRA